MRALTIAVCILALAGIARPVLAASEKDAADCKQGDDHKLRIAACTRIVNDKKENARERAGALQNRGLANVATQRYRRAISDFSAAIKIDPKDAAAYYNRGDGYLARGDNDRAIADFDMAIRLDPKLAEAYNDRGNALFNKADNDAAISSYGEAIRIDPQYFNAYYNRGNAHHTKGDYDRAIADFNEAIRIDPKDADGYLGRGLAFFYKGASAEALADHRKAVELDPKDADAVIWLDVIARRSNEPSQLAQMSPALDKKAWPAPVVRLLLGQITTAELITAADSFNRKTRSEHFCEAHFFAGQFALIRGTKAEAQTLFIQAVRDCPVDFIESSAARAELKALGVKP